MAHPPCTHQTPDGPCDTPATDRYLAGWRCTSHTPAALHGHPEPPVPDPEQTAVRLTKTTRFRTYTVTQSIDPDSVHWLPVELRVFGRRV